LKKLILLLLLPICSFSQNGPGGIGSTNKNSSLVIWLNANDVKQDTNSHVGLWLDNSGYKNHALIDAGLGPVLKSKGNNDFTLDFTANRNEYLIINSNNSIECDELSIYVVGKIRSKSDAWAGFIIKESGSSWNDGFGIGRFDNYKEIIAFSNNYEKFSIRTPFEFNEDQLLSYHHLAENIELFNKGKCIGEKKHNGKIDQNDDSFWIGWTGEFLDGEINEIIMFNEPNTLIQRRLIHNYLSSKYNIDIEEDLYCYDDSIHGNYNYGLAGIGMAEDNSMQIDACGDGMVTIKNPLDLNPDEYMIWSHNGISLDKNNSIDVPKGVTNRLKREWKVAEVDLEGNEVDVGPINIQFDLSTYTKINPLNLFLLIDADNDGLYSNEEPIPVNDVKDGSKIIFNNITQLKNGTKFTLGSSFNENNTLKTLLSQFEFSFLDSLININWSISEVAGVNSIIILKTDETVNDDTLTIINIDNDGLNKFTFMDNNLSEFNTIYSLYCVRANCNDTIKLGDIGIDYGFEKKRLERIKYENEQLRLLKDLNANNKKIDRAKGDLTLLFYMSITIILFIIFSLLIYFKKKSDFTKIERVKLLNEIQRLKQKGVAKSFTEPEIRNDLELDKNKLELAIDAKLGESSWMILNVLLLNPSISNKEIAEEVSLSLEGVSSSLRKMYVVFNVSDSSNKKIALLMEAIRISSEI